MSSPTQESHSLCLRDSKLPKEVPVLLSLSVTFPTRSQLLLPMGTRDPTVRANTRAQKQWGGHKVAVRRIQDSQGTEMWKACIYACMTSQVHALSDPGGGGGAVPQNNQPHHANYLLAPSPPPRFFLKSLEVCRNPCHVSVVFTLSGQISKTSNNSLQ